MRRKVKTYRKQRRLLTGLQWARSITFAQKLRAFGQVALFVYAGKRA